MDVHVPHQITRGLRRLGVDVLTSQEDATARWSDPDLLDRAAELDRILFSQDQDMLVEAARRQEHDIHFAGVIYASQIGLSINQTIRDLELIAKALEPSELINKVQYLPLKG